MPRNNPMIMALMKLHYEVHHAKQNLKVLTEFKEGENGLYLQNYIK